MVRLCRAAVRGSCLVGAGTMNKDVMQRRSQVLNFIAGFLVYLVLIIALPLLCSVSFWLSLASALVGGIGLAWLETRHFVLMGRHAQAQSYGYGKVIGVLVGFFYITSYAASYGLSFSMLWFVPQMVLGIVVTLATPAFAARRSAERRAREERQHPTANEE